MDRARETLPRPDPPDAAQARCGRPLPRAGRHHRLPRFGLLRPPRPRGAAQPRHQVRRRHRPPRRLPAHPPARRIELARDDDLRRRVRERHALGRPLPGPRLRGERRPREGGHGAADHAREHPPRPRMGRAKPGALRHPDLQRLLRRRLRSLVSLRRPLAGRREGDPRGDPRRRGRGKPRPFGGAPGPSPGLGPLGPDGGWARRQEPASPRGPRHLPRQLRPDDRRPPEAGSRSRPPSGSPRPSFPGRRPRPRQASTPTSRRRATTSWTSSSKRTPESTPPSTRPGTWRRRSSGSSSRRRSATTTSSAAPTSTSTAPASPHRSSPRWRRRCWRRTRSCARTRSSPSSSTTARRLPDVPVDRQGWGVVEPAAAVEEALARSGDGPAA